MIDENGIEKVRFLLSSHRQGLTISDIAQHLETNRSSALNILNYLVGSGEVTMRTYGRAKVYTLISRVPVARLMSLSSDLFLILDQDLYIEDFNESFRTFFEIDRDSTVGSNLIYTRIPSLFSQDIVHFLQEAVSGRRKEFESYVNIDGAGHFFKVTCIPVQQSEFSTWVALVMHDLTIHKKYEEELEHAVKTRTTELQKIENRFQILTDMAPVGIFETDNLGRCTYVNRKWCEMSGLSPEEAMGTGWEQALHPDDRDWIKKLWYEHAQDQSPWYHTYRFRDKQGNVTSLLGMAVALRDSDDCVSGYIGTNVDLTQRIEAEEMIQDLNAHLATILDDANDGIATLDRNRVFTSCNKAGCQILGYQKEDLIGHSVRMLYASDEYYEMIGRTTFLELVKTGHYRGEAEVISKDGSVRIIEVSLSHIMEKGNYAGIIKIFRDVTEKRRSETELSASEGELRSILDGLIDVVGVVDRDGVILYLNHIASGYFSMDSGSPGMGTNITDLFPPEQAGDLIEQCRHVIDSGIPLLRRNLVTIRGTEYAFLTRLIPLPFGEKKVPAVLFLCLDISLWADSP